MLASASPRRRELLAGLGLQFEVQPSDVDEAVEEGEAASAYVLRIARHKAACGKASTPGALVLGADTSVVVDGEILGKPADPEQARQMLGRLSGRAHQVLTAVALDGSWKGEVLVQTQVHFRPLRKAEIDWYVASGEPLDKAGGYGIQGRAGMFVLAVEGSASNVVGLPLAQTVALLEQAGLPLPWSQR